METNIDIYKASDNALYIVRSKYEPEISMKIVDILNEEAERVGLKTRFAWLPNEAHLEQFRQV